MEDYAKYLANEAKSDIVALHEFRILYSADQENYHFFFEGEEDSLFYMPEARRHIGTDRAFIYECGGKKNVIEVRERISSEGYDLKFCLFFVDRDYDDFLGTQVQVDFHTYITDHYSIESDMASTTAARIMMEDIIRLGKVDPEFARIEATIDHAFRSFYHAIRPLMAWILAAKEGNCLPNLRNTNGLKGIVVLTGEEASIASTGFGEFKRKVVTSERYPPISAILRWYRRLDPEQCKFWVRGKYDIWFFQYALLTAIQEANNRRRLAGQRSIRIPAALRDGRILEILGGRVPPPASLQAFYLAKLT